MGSMGALAKIAKMKPDLLGHFAHIEGVLPGLSIICQRYFSKSIFISTSWLPVAAGGIVPSDFVCTFLLSRTLSHPTCIDCQPTKPKSKLKLKPEPVCLVSQQISLTLGFGAWGPTKSPNPTTLQHTTKTNTRFNYPYDFVLPSINHHLCLSIAT